jgi:hypothetical protein
VRLKDPKDFRQRQPNPKPGEKWSIRGIELVLYHLPDLLASDPARAVWIVEGEKDVHTLERHGLVATTNAMGAEKWNKPQYAGILRGRTCIIIGDNDETGRRHVQQVAQSLAGKAQSIKVVDLLELMPDLPEKGDVSDFVAAGGTVDQLQALAERTKEWDPATQREEPAAPSPGADHPESRPAALKDQPIIGRSKKQASCQHNSALWLSKSEWAGKIRYDRFRRLVLVDGEAISDELIVRINGTIEAKTRTPWMQEHVRSALLDIAHKNKFNSLTEWLDSLTWDGQSRIDSFFCDAYGCKLDPYTFACAQVLFLSAVARAYEPGCQADVMVLLIGDQGIFKSTGMQALCHDPTWFTDDVSDLADSKKVGEGLQGKWIVEFSEFEKINRATLGTAKSFLTRKSDWYRPAYAKITKDFPRTCVFVGTSNPDQPLTDTENRRYMPIKCGVGKIGWIVENRDQLWAEAVKRYRDGEKWWVTNDEILAKCREHQEQARETDAWQHILDEAFEGWPTVTVLDVLGELKLCIANYDKSAQSRVGKAMKLIGFERDREGRGNAKATVWKRPGEAGPGD